MSTKTGWEPRKPPFSPQIPTHAALHPQGVLRQFEVTSTAILADLMASKRVFGSGLTVDVLLQSPFGSITRGRFPT